MCGIVGAVATRPIANLLINGLKKLEYRGYDSAGIATVEEKGELKRIRAVGKVKELESVLNQHHLNGHLGIAHTRWATHGAPSEANAHPLVSHDEFALVHNGIIENYTNLREKLAKLGYQFNSETDTEVAVHLLHHHMQKTKDLLAAVIAMIGELKGAYALGIISKQHPQRLIAVRQGSPLVIGRGNHENFLASDPLALLSVTQQFIYLEDNDIADISLNDVKIYNLKQELVNRNTHELSIQQDAVERGDYRHYMQKEIMEQPQAIHHCLQGRIVNDSVLPAIFGPRAETIFPQVQHIHFVACGTSYHAAMVAKYWIESLANIPCAVEVASEYRYREVAPSANSLYVTLSQSGETADSLAALRLAQKSHYLANLAICNVPGSTMMRESELHFLTHAGVEIGVASTKAFTTQLVALFMLALALRHTRVKDNTLEIALVKQLQTLPELIDAALAQDLDIRQWATSFTNKNHAIFLGRGALYPIALEGALKMKEISYIHAEGYPSGELKHGPLALVDNNMPVIATVPNDALLEKTLSNLQEVQARGGQLFILADQDESKKMFVNAKTISMPSVDAYLAPILFTVPLQLLAYHVAVLKGTDVDQPRNLAKSVTVE